MNLNCSVAETLVAGCDVILGMNGILKMGGVHVTHDLVEFDHGRVRFR